MEMTTTHNHSNELDTGFYDWLNGIVHTTTGLSIMVIVVFVLAVLSEGLGAAIKRIQARPVFWIRSRMVTNITHNILSTLAHAAKVALMFLLMVVFMALNAWLCVATIIGSAVGHLIFNWRLAWDSEAPDKEELTRSQW